MIPKHILMNNTIKSSIYRLVAYITDTQEKVSRVTRVGVHNCVTDDPVDAAREMEAVQLLNKRTKADKTYHLLLSFPAGEEPTDAQLASIEEDFCAALGYTDHQRISVVHRDTDNFHVHLAINKIHPRKLTIHEPHRDFRILQKAAEVIENTYQLTKTNHTPAKTQSENRIDDAEKMSGQETLATRIRTDCLQALQRAQSWEEVHAICERSGISLQLRGNGMVFTQLQKNAKVLAVKASTVAREFSKAKLEARFGTYREPPARQHDTKVDIHHPAVPTTNQPTAPFRRPSALWLQYTQARENWQEQSAAEQARIKAERAHRKKLIDQLYKVEKKLTKSSLPYWERRKRLQELQKEMTGRRKMFTKTHRVTGYLEWLQQRAGAGDHDAIIALRRRAFALVKNGKALLSRNGPPASGIPVDTITKQGTVIYAVGKEIIHDRGESFHVSSEVGLETLALAMQMTVKRSGSRLTLTGDDVFRQRCLEAAVTCNLAITFTDPELEKKRKRLDTTKIRTLKVPVERSSKPNGYLFPPAV